jgi:hypothetical protein
MADYWEMMTVTAVYMMPTKHSTEEQGWINAEIKMVKSNNKEEAVVLSS